MLVHTHGVVTHTLKYQDKHLIVHLFTEHYGMQHYLVRSALSGGKTALKAAHFQPLQLLEVSATYKNKGTLESFKDLRLNPPLHQVYTDPVKRNQAVLMAEVLGLVLRSEGPNPALFAYVQQAVLNLEQQPLWAEAHLAFLSQLTRYLGILPDVEGAQLPYFNPREGYFTAQLDPACWNADDTALLRRLWTAHEAGQLVLASGEQRSRALQLLLEYYRLHRDDMGVVRSAEVLTGVFR